LPADAVMLIGDRGMLPTSGRFEFEWDLGEEWWRWTGLPFVFAVWIARPGVDLSASRRPGRRPRRRHHPARRNCPASRPAIGVPRPIAFRTSATI